MSDQQLLQDIQTKMSKFQIFSIFSNQEIYAYLKVKGLDDFLNQIPSQKLRTALTNREEIEDQIAASTNFFRYNVLDFTLDQVIQHCWQNRLISFFEERQKNVIFAFRNHAQLGRRLAARVPLKYYIGDHSTHANKAREIQQLYGIHEQHKQDQQEEEYQNKEEQNMDDFIVQDDQEEYASEQDFYLDSISQQVNKKHRNKKIKKQKKKHQKIGGKQKIKKINLIESSQQENYPNNNSQLSDYLIEYQKPQKQQTTTKRRKNIIDSDDQ